MKKTFTFFVAKGLYTTPTNRLLCKVAIFVLVALFALPVMAGTIDVLDDSWIVDHKTSWETSYDSSTKTITFVGDWKGYGWYLESLNIPTSEWLSITVAFPSAAPKGVLKCEYTDGGTNEENFEGKTSQTLNFASGKTLKQIYLQLESSGSLTLTSAVVTTSTTTYTVSVTSSNGTVSGTGDFAENEEVTLTATPNENYSFTSWSTSDVNLSGHENENPLTFTMPGNDVSITANFSTCSGQTVTVNVNNEDMGSATGGGSYCAGVQVDLEATPNSGYRFVNWTVPSGSASLDNVNNASAHFTMSNPAAAVTVQANFEVDPCTNTKTVQCVSGYVPVTIHDHADQYVENKHETYVVTTHDNASAYYYPLSLSTTISSFTLSIHMANSQHDYAWFNLYKKTANNSGDVEYDGAYYNKVGWQHMVSSGSWNSGEFDDAITSFADGSEGVGSSIPSGDYLLALSAKNDAKFYYFTLTTSENIFCPNTITMVKSGDDGAAAPTAQVNSSNVTTAFEGAVVMVTAAAASAGHNFSGWTASPEVTFADASATSTTFTMPANAVTITANYEASVSSTFTYTTSGSGSITCATTSGSSVVSGTAIPMTAVPSTDYVFTGWSATAGSFSNPYALTTTFTMPAEDAEVTATFAQVDNIICYGVESGSAGDVVGGGATISGSNIKDFDAFDGNNIVKLSYEGMSGSSYASWDILKSNTYNSANSAGATGFGFYYKTETDADKVAMWFEPNTGGQQALQLNGTSNVWKYVYFAHSAAATWNQSQIRIYINGEQDGKSTANANGAIYLADIAATSITSKPDIKYYHYTNNRGGEMQVDEYGTLCLPMGGTIEGATLYSVAGKETGDINYLVLEDQGTNVVAGKPYITQSTATSYTVTMNGPHIAVQDGNGLVGTYETIDLTPYAEPGTLNYFLYANAFKKAGTGVTVGAYRAYLDWGEVSAPAQAPSARRIRMVIEGTEAQTGMETVTAMPKTTKVLIDGQLFIIREGKRYTFTGARAQ